VNESSDGGAGIQRVMIIYELRLCHDAEHKSRALAVLPKQNKLIPNTVLRIMFLNLNVRVLESQCDPLPSPAIKMSHKLRPRLLTSSSSVIVTVSSVFIQSFYHDSSSICISSYSIITNLLFKFQRFHS
jgi:hypothetical protein